MAAGRHAQPRRSRGRSTPTARGGTHRSPSRMRDRRLVALVAVPVVLGSGSAAYAFWTATGSGSATIGTTTVAPLTISAGSSALPALYPGRVVSFGFTVTNPNIYPVNLTRLTAVTVTSSDQVACPASTYIALPADVTAGVAGSGYVLPAALSVPASSTAQGSLTNLITMTTSAPDGCQGKTFTVTLSFTGSQV